MDGERYPIDYTDNLEYRGALDQCWFNASYCEFEIDYDVDLRSGNRLERFIIRLPYPIRRGTYTQADYRYDRGDYDSPMLLHTHRSALSDAYLWGTEFDVWTVATAVQQDNNSEMSISVDGYNSNYVWGAFDATLGNFDGSALVEVVGRFSVRRIDTM